MSKRSLVGRTLGDFRLVEIISSDPAGDLYRAKELSRDRTVAVRVIDRKHAARDGFEQSFLRDMKALTGAYHPNVITIYAAGRSEGVLYAAMRHVPAMTLRAMISQSGPLDHRSAGEVLFQIADGLAFAHDRGVVHGGISSDDILLRATDSGVEPSVTGFGLVGGKTPAGSDGITENGAGIGLGYTSPEQLSGAPADERSDVYALGCVLLEALTGSPPLADMREPGKLEKRLRAAPAPSASADAETPAALEAVITRALAKDPDDRFATVLEMAAAIPATGRMLDRWRGVLEAGTIAPGGSEPEPALAGVAAAPGRLGGESTSDRLVAVAAGSGSAGGEAGKAETEKGEAGKGKVKADSGAGAGGGGGTGGAKAPGDGGDAKPAPGESESGGEEAEQAETEPNEKKTGAWAVVGALGMLGVVAAVLALAGAFEGDSEPASEPGQVAEAGKEPPAGENQTPEQGEGGGDQADGSEAGKPEPAGTSGELAPWPGATGAYTAVAFASATDRAEARARAQKAARLGFRAGVLDSSDYPSLVPGVWVAFAGVYESSEDAARAVERLQRAGVAANPYVRFVGGS